jgi:hypothetical protein
MLLRASALVPGAASHQFYQKEASTMRLEHLCDMEQGCQGGLKLIQPYASEEGTGFGVGEGLVSGDLLAMRIRWVNHPQRRSDGAILADAHGVITTGEGVPILCTLRGRTVAGQTGNPAHRQHLLSAFFEAEEERHGWLNTAVCIAEGQFNPETLRLQLRIYACISDLH